VKPQDDGLEVIELHPLVRAFVRQNFAKPERDWFIQAILAVYKAFIGAHRSDLQKQPGNNVLDYWTEGAELHISAGEYADAIGCLYEITSGIQRRGSPNEFVRVTRTLLQSSDWAALKKINHFDELLATFVEIQALTGNIEECTRTLEAYGTTLDGEDARYINYCDINCYMHWVNGDFLTAIKWGTEGEELKERSNVDTNFDTSHNLALARRDAGFIEPALRHFLNGKKLTEVIAEKAATKSFSAPSYGNVGRCLHLMSQIEPALSCYRKSAL
jgi:tetratricopeptide (TPR) repeat protein